MIRVENLDVEKELELWCLDNIGSHRDQELTVSPPAYVSLESVGVYPVYT